MKLPVTSTFAILVTLVLTSGCLNLQLGGGTSNRPQVPSVGQQLMDLQQARDKGAISESEYQAAKSRLLQRK